jgi:PhnB protein
VPAHLAPWISVPSVVDAIAFYRAAFGAAARYSLEDDAGRPVVARLAIGEGDADFWLQEEPGVDVPPGGGVIRMILTVDDPDVVFARAVSAGAVVVADMYEGHGWRIGRVADPFGHHWEIGKQLAQTC